LRPEKARFRLAHAFVRAIRAFAALRYGTYALEEAHASPFAASVERGGRLRYPLFGTHENAANRPSHLSTKTVLSQPHGEKAANRQAFRIPD
jgi:hypothetical protein